MQISFILVEPAVPENVGAAARALKTMGFTELRLVNPCDYLSVAARKLAHGSNDILENASVYGSLRDAIADLDFTFATSARDRWIKLDIIDCQDLPAFIENKGNAINRIGIVFGREESGLTNDEMNLCHRVTTVPLIDRYPSLNLAQSVMIYAYTLSRFSISQPKRDAEYRDEDSLKALIAKVEIILRDIDLGPDKLIHGRLMERLSELGEHDIKLMHSLTSSIIERYKIRGSTNP